MKQFPDSSNKAVSYIYSALNKINDELKKDGKSLNVFYGEVDEIFRKLMLDYDIEAIYVNADYEPEAIKRDGVVRRILQDNSIQFHEFHDQLIMPPGSVLKADGTPYTIFTPFSKVWKQKIDSDSFKFFVSESLKSNFVDSQNCSLLSLKDVGYQFDASIYHDFYVEDNLILNYEKNRDFPFITDGTSKVSTQLRFGIISIRKLAKKSNGNQ